MTANDISDNIRESFNEDISESDKSTSEPEENSSSFSYKIYSRHVYSNDYNVDHDSEKTQMKESSLDFTKYLTNIIIFVGIPLCLGLLFWLLYYKSPSTNQSKSYDSDFESLKATFTLDDPRSWKLLNGSLFQQLFRSADSLERPAVIMAVGEREKLESFHKGLERLISVKFQCFSCCATPLDSVEYGQNMDHFKSSTLEFLIDKRKIGMRCVKMGAIDRIPAELGPILHGLTDDYNAIHKDMIYLFSLFVDGERSSPKVIYDEQFVVNVLRSAWQPKMGLERFEALISRLAGTVIGIR